MSARKSKKSLKKPASKPGRGRLARRAGGARSAKPAKKRATARPAKKPARRPARPVAKTKAATRAKGKGKSDKAKTLRLEKQKKLAQREREQKQKLKLKEQLEKERERERVAKAREKERLDKEREKERVRKEKEKARAEQEKAKQKALALKQREEERERERKAAADEKARKIAERDALRDQLRKQKDEERARRDAEREAYRKAKEVERERLRAEREAARRALEGKVARASKRLARQDGMGRGISTTRVYRPDAIPNQAGTTRRGNQAVFRPLGVRPFPVNTPSAEDLAAHAEAEAAAANAEPARPTPPPPVQLSVEERYQLITERLGRADAAFQREYRENFDMSWIYHDSALEGVVYTFEELKAAVDPSVAVVPDSSLQPACEEIRRHRLAIELVRDLAERKRVPINVDMVKKLYVTLHPEEGDVKTVKYRKDIPQHRLYFHEYVPPDKIAYRVRQIIDWLNGPEPKKMKNPLRVAARVHYDLVRVFPFQTDSGKVSRMLMNLILMRSGYPPAIVHSTERQKYYEALKGQLPTIIQMASDAIYNALNRIDKVLDEYESRPRSGAAPAPTSSAQSQSQPRTPSQSQAPSEVPPPSEPPPPSERSPSEPPPSERSPSEPPPSESSPSEPPPSEPPPPPSAPSSRPSTPSS